MTIYRGLGVVVIVFAAAAYFGGDYAQSNFHTTGELRIILTGGIFAFLCIFWGEWIDDESRLIFSVEGWGYLTLLLPALVAGAYIYLHDMSKEDVKKEVLRILENKPQAAIAPKPSPTAALPVDPRPTELAPVPSTPYNSTLPSFTQQPISNDADKSGGNSAPNSEVKADPGGSSQASASSAPPGQSAPSPEVPSPNPIKPDLHACADQLSSCHSQCETAASTSTTVNTILNQGHGVPEAENVREKCVYDCDADFRQCVQDNRVAAPAPESVAPINTAPEQRTPEQSPPATDTTASSIRDVAHLGYVTFLRKYANADAGVTIEAIKACYVRAERWQKLESLQFCVALDTLAVGYDMSAASKGAAANSYLTNNAFQARQNREFEALGVVPNERVATSKIWFDALIEQQKEMAGH